MKRTISAAILAAVVSSSSTSFAQVPERREATVDYVWFKGAPRTDSVGGGTSPVTLRVEASHGGAPVGVEGPADGRAVPWAAAGWTAAFVASSRATSSLLANQFTISGGGDVDGPSAGMLATATFLALLRGDAVKIDVTMTGTINPDGTSGPVGGIPQKLAGAAAAGKKVFGYPLGMRQAEDLRTGSTVDVEGLATALGVRAVEVKTVRDAYLLLTGVDLGVGGVAVDAATLRVPPDLAESLRIRVDMWRASAESSFARIKPVLDAMPANEKQTLSWITAPIFAAVKQGVAYEKAGLLLAAEQRWMEVAVATAAAEDELAIIEAAKLGKLEQAFGVLLPYLDLEAQAKSTINEVGAALGMNGADAVDAILAVENVVAALAEIRAGKRGLQAAVDTIKQLEKGAGAANAERHQRFVLMLLETAPVLARAESTLAAARMDLAFAGTPATATSSSIPAARSTSLTKAYASAAAAGKTYVEARIGLDAVGSASFAFMEPAWATASTGGELAASLVPSATKPTEAERVLALAAGAQAYLSAAALQNKYDALDYNNGVVGRRAALASQLSMARESALAAIGDVQRRTGSIPPRLVVEFNRAEELKGGVSDDDRLDALSAYWRASFAATLLGELVPAPARNVTTTTTTTLPTLRLPPDASEPVVKKGVKPSRKLPPRKPPPKKIKAK